MEPTGITTFRQADVGEYLREVCISWAEALLLSKEVFFLGGKGDYLRMKHADDHIFTGRYFIYHYIEELIN